MVVFDMDETLLHSLQDAGPASSKLKELLASDSAAQDEDGTGKAILSLRRPHALELLKFLNDNSEYDIGIFTAATKEGYAAPLLQSMLTDAEAFVNPKKIFYRSSCGELHCIKDLRRFRQSFERIILVDDLAYKNGFCQIDNTVNIEAFEGDMSDGALLNLKELLETLRTEPDVRNILKHGLADGPLKSGPAVKALFDKQFGPVGVKLSDAEELCEDPNE